MNLFYEDYPDSVIVNGENIPIVTDFREYIKLLDMLNDDELLSSEKVHYLSQYFLKQPGDFSEAMDELTAFILMKTDDQEEEEGSSAADSPKKDLYSFEYDYPFIFSAFLSEYGINLRLIPYMHWWEFRSLFDGLSGDTEIKQRIQIRGTNLSEIKDKNERKRIQKIQDAIRLPNQKVSDYDIGDAFGW